VAFLDSSSEQKARIKNAIVNMNSLSSSESEDKVLHSLLDYCLEHAIHIPPSVSLRRVPGKGLGVYTDQPLEAGECLMHVPTAALITPDTVPTSFADAGVRDQLSVHALLAAYLAFGFQDLSSNQYGRWMATWPRLSDFSSTMPLLWPDKTKAMLSVHPSARYPGSGEVRGEGGSTARPASRMLFVPTSPAMQRIWSTRPWAKPDSQSCAGLVTEQQTKFSRCVDRVAKCFPDRVLDIHHQDYWSFVHMWCCINTRCFYYVKPGDEPPNDSNDAMALCPGMDLFNHTDHGSCKTRYDEGGYYVIADRDYGAGEELLLTYGSHNNDALWTEYGFMLNENQQDAIQLDEVVLSDTCPDQKRMLDRRGYLGEYWLGAEGVCWRTEVVAWLSVLNAEEWQRLLDGSFDPHGRTKEVKERNLSRKDNMEVVMYSETPTSRAKRKIVEWILQVRREAENSLRGLHSMDSQAIVESFADDDIILTARRLADVDIGSFKDTEARQRYGMCVQRWKQIWEMCMAALRNVEREYEGSLATVEEEKPEEDLRMTVDDFLNTLADRG